MYDFTYKGEAYFIANDGIHGTEIWKTDGTKEGTMMLKEIYPGNNLTFQVSISIFNNKLYFFKMNEGGYYHEIWESDGTTEGTKFIKKISARGINLVATLEKHILFASKSYIKKDGKYENQNQLWRTDGTEIGTEKINLPVDLPFYDINFKLYRNDPTQISPKSMKGSYYFQGGNNLWKTDGTEEGTSAVGLNNTYIAVEKAFTNIVIGKVNSGLFISDGTPSGTFQKDIRFPTSYLEHQGKVYFTASPTDSHRELYVTDGTSEGTRMIESTMTDPSFSSQPRSVHLYQNEILYFAEGKPYMTNLYKLSDKSYQLTGKVFADLNTNGQFDEGEPTLSNQKLRLNPGNITVYTNEQGIFAIRREPGDYQLTLDYNQEKWGITTAKQHEISLPADKDQEFNFGLEPKEVYEAAATFTSKAPRCSFEVPYYFTLRNTGSIDFDATVKVTLDPTVTYLESTPFPLEVDGQTLTYALDQVGLGSKQKIELLLKLPGVDNIGDTLKSFYEVQLKDAAQQTIQVLSDTLEQPLECAYDPNDKQTVPAGVGKENFTLKNQAVKYLIRFQNVGNAEAYNITIRDTLDNHFDWNTFQLLDVSHTVNIQRSEEGALEFYFENIHLPDSASSAQQGKVEESEGYLLYEIRPKAGLPEHTVVKNTASIYFDYNPPIVTNTTQNTLVTTIPELTTGLPEQFNVFPNPTQAYLYIQGTQTLQQAEITLLDAFGKLVRQQQVLFEDNTARLSTEGLKPGVYILNIRHAKFKANKMFVKQ
ncbi:DUF7619 domain-containing protein [Rapidithrix thailandica]